MRAASVQAPPPARMRLVGWIRRRKWKLIGLSLLGFVLTGLVSFRIYLSSAGAAQMASASMSAQLGIPVRIKNISPDFDSTTLDEIEIAEANGANNGKPWVTVRQLQLSNSVVGLLRGKTPDQITLREADVTLRFDHNGVLLTQLPKSESASSGMPTTIRLERSRLTIHQDSHPDAHFHGIDAELRREGDRYVLNGTLADSSWGRWDLSLNVDAQSGAGSASLRTTGAIKVTTALLRKFPFVNQSVWDAVSLDGETTADIRFDFRPSDDYFHYVVAVEPRQTNVFVSSIDLHATEASGSVTVENSEVILKNVRGRAAQGMLELDGSMNFREETDVLSLKIQANGMRVKDLPPAWGIEGKVPVKGVGDGIFIGKADLVVKNNLEGTTTAGTGTATVVIPNFVSGQELRVDLTLRPKGRRFEFGQPPSKPTSFRKEEANFAHLASAFLVLVQAPIVPEKAFEKKKPEPKDAPPYLDLNFALRDVDLNELLKKLEYEIPLKVSGRITFEVKASVPTDQMSDLKKFRFAGTAHLPLLTIEDMQLEEVQAKVVYRDGKLTLTEFSARMPEPANPKAVGTIKGTAKIDLIPAGDLTAQLDIDRLPVAQILGLFPNLAKEAEGNFSGHLEFKAPSGQLRDPTKWAGSAQLTAARAKAIGWVVENLRLDSTLANGTLVLSKLTGKIEGAALNASGELELRDKFPFKGLVEFAKIDLNSLDKLAPDFKLPVRLAGQLTANAGVKGTLNPLRQEIIGIGSVTDLRINDFPITKLDFRWDLNHERFRASDLNAKLLGGSINGTVELPLREEAGGRVELKLKEIDLAELSKNLPNDVDIRLAGKADGSLSATIATKKANQPRQTTAEIAVESPKLNVRNIPAEKLRATAIYREGTLTYKLEANALGGTITLDGRYPNDAVKEPAIEQPPQGLLRLRGVKLAQLWPALGSPDTLEGLNGEINLELPFRYDGAGNPVGVGTLRLENLRFREREISTRILSVARLSGKSLRFEKIDAPFGTGSIRGLVILNLINLDRSRAILTLRNVPSSNVFFAFPDLAKRLNAPLDVQIRTSLGMQIRGTAVISAAQGKFLGQSMGMVRIPIEWDLVPSQQRGVVSVHDLSGELAQGRLAGHARYEFFGYAGGRVEGEIGFTNVNIPSLVRTEQNLGSLGVGHATGRFEFSGDNVRSVDDLTGVLTATLGQAQLSEIPVLREVLPFLGASARVAD
ncbi:MAG: hypothetical protein K8T89_25400, partial [Planctomycetes bacterium]|nr:hypothetical protein [Planctomycetota bacterium]